MTAAACQTEDGRDSGCFVVKEVPVGFPCGGVKGARSPHGGVE